MMKTYSRYFRRLKNNANSLSSEYMYGKVTGTVFKYGKCFNKTTHVKGYNDGE